MTTPKQHSLPQADINARYHQIIQWRDAGKTRVEIAALLGITRQRVEQLERVARDQAAYHDAKKASLPPPTLFAETPLQAINIDRRTLLALQRYGLHTIEDVMQRSDAELLEIRRIGVGHLHEIRVAIEQARIGRTCAATQGA
jgi:DNA-directed RNA polymerase alpha subunit